MLLAQGRILMRVFRSVPETFQRQQQIRAQIQTLHQNTRQTLTLLEAWGGNIRKINGIFRVRCAYFILIIALCQFT
jgi:hypothetical protein